MTIGIYAIGEHSKSGIKMKVNSMPQKPTQTASWQKGDVLSPSDIPEWASHIVGNHPQQYHWLHPVKDGRIKIMQNVTLDKYGPEITVQICR